MYFDHKIMKFAMLVIGLILLLNLSAMHLQPHGES